MSNAACSDAAGTPAICRPNKGCVTLTSQDCTEVTGDHRDDGAVLVGFMGPLVGEYASIGVPIKQGAALAFDEIRKNVVGLPSTTGGKPRPLVMVSCHDLDDAERAAHHLVDDIGVPAIIGPAFSGITIKVTTKVTVPAGVLTISASATNPGITSLADNGLVWRTVASDAIQALPLAALVPGIEAQVRAQLKLMPTEKIKLALAVKGDAYGTGLADAVSAQLKFNGASPSDPANTNFFKRFDYDDGENKNYDFAPVVTSIKDFAPHVLLVLGTNEGITKIMGGVESAWPTTGTPPPRPRYLFPDGGRLPELTMATMANEDLRKRVLGTVPGRKAALYDAFKIRFKGANGADPGTYSENAYDAAYLLAYAAAAAGSAPLTGANLAAGLKKTVPPGTPTDVGPNQLSKTFPILESGNSIDFAGASGPLDFDLDTGEAKADIDIWCVDRDNMGATVFVSSGGYYDATKGTIEGKVSCLQ